MTAKQLLYHLIFSIIFCLAICYIGTKVYALETGELRYDDSIYIDYSKINKTKNQNLADLYLSKALKEKNQKLKTLYLQRASGEYFIWTKTEPENIYPKVQIARIYDYQNKNSFSKAYFFQALKIDKNDTGANYYFGDYYFFRKEYTKALKYYNIAFEHGLRENFDVLYKMGIMYEKLGDLLRANQYYKKAYLLKPENQTIPDKIRSIEAVKYKKTGYYYLKRN